MIAAFSAHVFLRIIFAMRLLQYLGLLINSAVRSEGLQART